MNLKNIFEEAENGVLTYDQLMSACKEAGIKLADLSTGEYVSKKKYEDELSAKDNQITSLNSTLGQRDVDLTDLQNKLREAGTDTEKLNALNTQFTDLQSKYDADIKNYQNQLAKQAYEFAVKDFASTKTFTSKAAKRDFINSMIAKELKMDGDKILGADDFVNAYSADNEDAFLQEMEFDPEPIAKPQFIDSTSSGGDNPNGGGFNFSFTGVRSHD